MFECPKRDEWRVKRWVDGRLRSWEDLGLDVWTDREGEELVDNVRTFFSQVDLRQPGPVGSSFLIVRFFCFIYVLYFISPALL